MRKKSFPWLFPHGTFGYTYPRPVTIGPAMYFRSRLYNIKPTWRRDLSYLLHAAVASDILQLKQVIGVYLKVTHGQNQMPLTAGYLRDKTNNDECFKNSYMFMKNIRGTIAYYRNSLNDLLAMLRFLGPPTL